MEAISSFLSLSPHPPPPHPVALSLRGREKGFVREPRTYCLGGWQCEQELLTKRKDNDQFPGIVGTTVQCSLALCRNVPTLGSQQDAGLLPSESSQPRVVAGKEQIPVQQDGGCDQGKPRTQWEPRALAPDPD